MSTTSIASLGRISRDELFARLTTADPAKTPSTSTASAPSLAVIDVRDSDHVGGHIKGSRHVPSGSLDHRIPELVRELQGTGTVVFHCALSQQRGPGAALRYLRERERMLGSGDTDRQAVVVLDGGFVKWQEKFGTDERVTEAYQKDIWQEL